MTNYKTRYYNMQTCFMIASIIAFMLFGLLKVTLVHLNHTQEELDYYKSHLTLNTTGVQ